MGFRQQNRAPRLLDPRPRRTLKARLPECRAFIPRVPGEEAQEVASAVIEAVDHRFSRLSVHDPSFDTSSAIDALSSSEKAFVTISGRIPFTFIVSGLTPDIVSMLNTNSSTIQSNKPGNLSHKAVAVCMQWATINIRLYGEEAPSAARFVVVSLRQFRLAAVAAVSRQVCNIWLRCATHFLFTFCPRCRSILTIGPVTHSICGSLAPQPSLWWAITRTSSTQRQKCRQVLRIHRTP